MAAAAVKDAVAMLAGGGYREAGAPILAGSGKPLPELAGIPAAHPLICTAEGVVFRDVLNRACEEGGLSVAGIKEREVLEACGGAAHLFRRVEGAAFRDGKTLGPPVTQDEKLPASALTIPYLVR